MMHDGAVIVADNIYAKILVFQLISYFLTLTDVNLRSDPHS